MPKFYELDYDTAKYRHGAEVTNILLKLINSRSKHKFAKPNELKWWYDFYTIIPRGSIKSCLKDHINNISLSKEQKLKNTLNNSKTLLVSNIGKWSTQEIIPNPIELESHLIQNIDKYIK